MCFDVAHVLGPGYQARVEGDVTFIYSVFYGVTLHLLPGLPLEGLIVCLSLSFASRWPWEEPPEPRR